MDEVTAEDVTNVATEFASEEEERIDLFIEYADAQVPQGTTNRKFAVVLLTAHLLTLANRASSGGSVKREKIGDLETEYFGTDGSGGVDETTYGKMYATLVGGGFAVGDDIRGLGVLVV